MTDVERFESLIRDAFRPQSQPRPVIRDLNRPIQNPDQGHKMSQAEIADLVFEINRCVIL